jgi:hypothetical protein
MKKLLCILALSLLPASLSAGDLHKRASYGEVIAATTTLASSRSFEIENTIQGREGGTWGLMLLWVAITDANDSETGVSLSCTASEDNNTTDWRIPACVWSAANTRYDCEAGPLFWNPSDETSPKRQLFRIDVEGIEDIECTFAFTGGASADFIEVRASFAMKG